jgi:hypothetical protein
MEKANKAIEFMLAKMPDNVVPYDHTAATTVDLLFQLGQKEKAIEMAKLLGDRADVMATYLIEEGSGLSQELRRNIFILNSLQTTLYQNGEMELGKKYEDAFNKHLSVLQGGGAVERGDY